MSEPSIVGVHWFQYLDQPVTGRLLDGENGHFGLVGITDLPFQGFVDSVRKSNCGPSINLAKRSRRPGPRRKKPSHDAEGGKQGVPAKVRRRALAMRVGIPLMAINR